MDHRHGRGRRNAWLGRLREHLALQEGDPFPLWAAQHDVLIAAGVEPRKASQMALRGCQLAIMLLAGAEQRAAANQLAVAERTAKLDAQRLRTVVESGVLASPPTRRGRLPR